MAILMVIEPDSKIIEEGVGDGPLRLVIYCTKCKKYFEINPEALMTAAILGTPFIKFLRYVQNSPCEDCMEKEDVVD